MIAPGFHHYAIEANGELSLGRSDYEPGFFRPLVYRSALLRYLIFNLKAGYTVRELPNMLSDALRREGGDEDLRYVGNTSADATEERLEDSAAVIAAFFRDLPSHSGMPPERIIFVLDGLRSVIYTLSALARARESYIGRTRRKFMKHARNDGYRVIDLHPVFTEHFGRRHGQRFEFPTDGHWDALGHEIAAEQVIGSSLFKDIFAASIN